MSARVSLRDSSQPGTAASAASPARISARSQRVSANCSASDSRRTCVSCAARRAGLHRLARRIDALLGAEALLVEGAQRRLGILQRRARRAPAPLSTSSRAPARRSSRACACERSVRRRRRARFQLRARAQRAARAARSCAPCRPRTELSVERRDSTRIVQIARAQLRGSAPARAPAPGRLAPLLALGSERRLPRLPAASRLAEAARRVPRARRLQRLLGGARCSRRELAGVAAASRARRSRAILRRGCARPASCGAADPRASRCAPWMRGCAASRSRLGRRSAPRAPRASAVLRAAARSRRPARPRRAGPSGAARARARPRAVGAAADAQPVAPDPLALAGDPASSPAASCRARAAAPRAAESAVRTPTSGAAIAAGPRTRAASVPRAAAALPALAAFQAASRGPVARCASAAGDVVQFVDAHGLEVVTRARSRRRAPSPPRLQSRRQARLRAEARAREPLAGSPA